MKWTKSAFATFFAAQIMLTAGVGATAMAAPAEANLPVTTQATSMSDVVGIAPRKDSIVWKYKSVNGQAYRRKFNESRNVWIGDWEIY